MTVTRTHELPDPTPPLPLKSVYVESDFDRRFLRAELVHYPFAALRPHLNVQVRVAPGVGNSLGMNLGPLDARDFLNALTELVERLEGLA